MAAVAHISPIDVRRLALVRTGPVVRPARTTLPAAIYRRRQAVALLVVLSVCVALFFALQGLWAALGGGPLGASQRPGATGGAVYVVQPGDTFWAIATQLRPNEDPRPLVARLVAAHGSPVLVAGERLAVPIGS